MAWSSPRTWVADEIVTKALLDTELRDNLNELALHDHSGGSGSGTRAMGGSATGLITVYMRDGAGPGTPTGTISAVFTTGSRLAMHSSGGTVVLFATSGHEHGITEAQDVVSMPSGATLKIMSSFGTHGLWLAEVPTQASASLQTATLSTSITITGTGKRSVAVTAGYCVLSGIGGGAPPTFAVRVFRDGATVATSNLIWSTSASGSGLARLIVTGTIDPTLAAAAYTYAVTIQRVDSTQGYSLPGAFIDVKEVSVP